MERMEQEIQTEMNNYKKEKNKTIKLDKWPVLFSDWFDAYIIQIKGEKLEKYTPKNKKDSRESIKDKIMFRARLVFDSFAEEAKQGKDSIDWMVSKTSTSFIQENRIKKLFFKWRNRENKKLIALSKQYMKEKDSVRKYVKENEKKWNRKEWARVGWRWDKFTNDDAEEYVELMLEYGERLLKLETIKTALRNKYERFCQLEPGDLYKNFIFKYVSKVESDFYCILLEDIPSTRDVLEDLKNDKWWVIGIETRERLLRSVELLMSEDNRYWSVGDLKLIAQKLLRPHEYILTKAANSLLCSVDCLYSYGDNRCFRFLQDNASGFLEVEYTDILNLEKDCKKETNFEMKKGDGKIEKKIMDMAQKMNSLSQELSNFMDEIENKILEEQAKNKLIRGKNEENSNLPEEIEKIILERLNECKKYP